VLLCHHHHRCCCLQVRTGHRVAIIGSGPAGLAAADQLNKMGHEVRASTHHSVTRGVTLQSCAVY
jgi:NADPH-dependent 2,4-dienoyl-CoA reductase/sulfur reductase-like enzyme